VKRTLVFLLLLALAPRPALAFNLDSLLDGIASRVCGLQSSVGIPGLITIALPIQQMFDLQGFCRSYEIYKKGKNFGKILAGAGQLALQNIFQGFVDAFAGAFGPTVKSALDPFNDLLQAFAKQANGLFNAPYLAASAVYDLVYSSAYKAIYDDLNSQATDPQVSAPADASATVSPVDGDLAAQYAYPDPGEVARVNQAVVEEKSSASSILSDAAAVADNATRTEKAKAEAESFRPSPVKRKPPERWRKPPPRSPPKTPPTLERPSCTARKRKTPPATGRFWNSRSRPWRTSWSSRPST
jgi:hypothetical protein